MESAEMRAAIAVRMREPREARRLRRNELAYAAGVSLSTLSRMEAGTTGVSTDAVGLVARALGVSVAEFFDSDLFRGGAPAAVPPRRAVPDPEAAVLAVLRRNPRATVSAACDVTGLSHSTVERAIARLKAEGRLRREGNNRTGRWVVVGDGDEGDG